MSERYRYLKLGVVVIVMLASSYTGATLWTQSDQGKTISSHKKPGFSYSSEYKNYGKFISTQKHLQNKQRKESGQFPPITRPVLPSPKPSVPPPILIPGPDPIPTPLPEPIPWPEPIPLPPEPGPLPDPKPYPCPPCIYGRECGMMVCPMPYELR